MILAEQEKISNSSYRQKIVRHMYPVLRVAIGVVKSKGLDNVSMLTEGSHMEGS